MWCTLRHPVCTRASILFSSSFFLARNWVPFPTNLHQSNYYFPLIIAVAIGYLSLLSNIYTYRVAHVHTCTRGWLCHNYLSWRILFGSILDLRQSQHIHPNSPCIMYFYSKVINLDNILNLFIERTLKIWLKEYECLSTNI